MNFPQISLLLLAFTAATLGLVLAILFFFQIPESHDVLSGDAFTWQETVATGAQVIDQSNNQAREAEIIVPEYPKTLQVSYLNLPWREIETQKDVFDPQVIAEVRSQLESNDLPVVVVLSAFDKRQLLVPPDLLDSEIGSKKVTRRYKPLLSFIDAKLSGLDIIAFTFGTGGSYPNIDSAAVESRQLFLESAQSHMRTIGSRYPNGYIESANTVLSDELIYNFTTQQTSPDSWVRQAEVTISK